MKVDKKKLAAIVDLAKDMIIADPDKPEIVKAITAAYIAIGYDAVAASDRAWKTVGNAFDTLNDDRRLYTHDQPSTVDLDDQYEVILYIRDLLNLQDFLSKEGMDEEILVFIRKLKGHGWGDNQVHEFITKAGQNTNFEHAKGKDGKREVPRQIPERGDRQEYLRNRFRLSK